MQVPENQALDGILWYNNDEQVIFPRLLVGTGYADQPGLVTDAITVSEAVSGQSSAWSTVEFDVPVGATLDGLYVIFEFPNQPYTAPGNGGGAAIGYSEASNGSVGWISGDGEQWSSLHPDFGFSILPVFVPFTEGMAVKSLDGSGPDEPQEEVVEQVYLTAGPNPFNPRTEVRFGLPEAANVKLEVFDLRGYLINRLAHGHFEAGHHEVTWLGKDNQGSNVASGVYFVRMVSGDKELTQRLTLVR